MPLPGNSTANQHITAAEAALAAVRAVVFYASAVTPQEQRLNAQRAILATIDAEAAIRRLQFTLGRSEDAVDGD